MKIFVDHNLPPRLARSLQALFEGEHEIVCLKDKFSVTISDIDWISKLSEEGKWVVLSADQRITKNKSEKMAFKNSKLIGFFMSSGFYKKGHIIQMSRILFQWDKILNIYEAMEPGATFQITEKTIRQI